MTTEVGFVYCKRNDFGANWCGPKRVRKKTQDKGLATMAKSSIMTELMTVIAKRKTELDAGRILRRQADDRRRFPDRGQDHRGSRQGG